MLQLSALFINLLLDINGVYSSPGYFVGPNKLTYEAAQAYCVDNGGNLASITSAGDQTEAQSKCFGEASEACWFGLNDRDGEGSFRFIDGKSFGVNSYTNWYPGEPNNLGNEDCVEVSFGFNGKWNDFQCGIAQYPLCQESCLAPRPCYQITDEETCISSRDSRTGWLNQPCTWCHAGQCTGNNGNRCEPVEWLFERTNQYNAGDYEIASSIGLTPRPCYQITDASLCLSSRDSRAGWLDQPCVWCAAGPCTTNNNNRCEPVEWLFEQNQLNPQHYEVAVACTALTGDCLVPKACYQLTDIESCLSSRDSRAGWLNQPCTWCHGGQCTGNNGNRCEPTEWLFERNNQLNPGDYEIASSGLTSRTCYSITDRSVCLSSKDDRANYLDEPCVWCAGGPCTGNNNNQCEPVGWLFQHTNQQNADKYEVAVACVDNQAANNIEPVMDFTNNKAYGFEISQSTLIFIIGIIMLLLIANIIVMWCFNCGRTKRSKYTAVKLFDSSADEMEKKELNH